ncbi:SLBB domain-containing protein [Gemmatimonas sp.]|uniref:polysaccharide biosynthesis/export family protein n=1 Tax=Gemmatimonas sp. TaxID=1962908 RepID=UPI00261FEBF7|nr:SLBB domain-containing protein [Gemmatimonas sp.]
MARVLVVAAMLATTGTRANAQDIVAAGPQRATRDELTTRVAELQSRQNASRGSALGRVRREMSVIQQRLQTGDFRVGDRFVVSVRMDSVRIDTVLVRDSLRVLVLNLPEVSVAGVLRSELEAHINTHVARYVRNATVRTSVLTRVSVLGAVLRPGIYYAAPDRPVSDLLMLAGGPLPDAKIDQFQASRGATRLLDAKAAKRIVKDGSTLEEVDIQSGDEVRFSQQRKINWGLVVQLAFVASSLFFAALQFIQWYYSRQD